MGIRPDPIGGADGETEETY